MSTLIDRREFRHPYGWAPEEAHPVWKDLCVLTVFLAIGLCVALFAIVMGIPLGESEL